MGHITTIPGDKTFPLEPPPKKFPFPSYGSFFGAHPIFWPFHTCVTSLLWVPLNFGPSSTKLGGTVRAIKNWPTMTTDLVPAGIADKRPFFCLAEKYFFGQKSVFFRKKNTQTLLKDWYLFWKGILFCLHNFSRSWLESRSYFSALSFRVMAVLVKKCVKKSSPSPLWGSARWEIKNQN